MLQSSASGHVEPDEQPLSDQVQTSAMARLRDFLSALTNADKDGRVLLRRDPQLGTVCVDCSPSLLDLSVHVTQCSVFFSARKVAQPGVLSTILRLLLVRLHLTPLVV